MINIYNVYLIIVLHFIFDWLLQPHKVAQAKSKEAWALYWHATFNILPYLLICGWLIKFDIPRMTFNLGSHMLIDYNIYRIHRWWSKEQNYNNEQSISLLFKFIAIDQILHLCINVWTFS